jgi:glycosyltransferase involved in cell wall biosynthesis
MPWRLVRFLSIRGVLSELARELVTRASRRLTSALVRRSGCMVVAMNREVAARFAGLEAPVVVEPHVAVDPVTAPPASVDETASQNGRRALFVGRLLSLKGPYLAIAAMTALPEEWTLDVYGEGPEAAGMRRRAERLGVANRVRLLGQRPREEVRTALQQADVLLFPSMHDSGGWTVAEAVSVGCPVVCLDVCGPPVLIEGTTGEAVPANALAPKRLAEAMIRVRRHPPSDRWSGARLSATVQRWYAQAIAHHTAVTAQHPVGR